MNSVKGDPISGFFSVLAICFLLLACSPVGAQQPISQSLSFPFQGAVSHRLSRQDELLLEDLQHRSFNYFWEQGNRQTGLVPDRARTDGSALDENHRNVASI